MAGRRPFASGITGGRAAVSRGNPPKIPVRARGQPPASATAGLLSSKAFRLGRETSVHLHIRRHRQSSSCRAQLSAYYRVALRPAAEGPSPHFASCRRDSAFRSRFDLVPPGPSLTSPRATASLHRRCLPAATSVQQAHETPARLSLRRRWLRRRSRGRELALEAPRPA